MPSWSVGTRRMAGTTKTRTRQTACPIFRRDPEIKGSNSRTLEVMGSKEEDVGAVNEEAEEKAVGEDSKDSNKLYLLRTNKVLQLLDHQTSRNLPPPSIFPLGLTSSCLRPSPPSILVRWLALST